jgi:CBS domain containing-hemolysin-like protein
MGMKWADRFLHLKENIDKPLSAILTLNTCAHTVGAAGVGAQATLLFGEAYFGLVSAILTILILVLTEIIPKTLGTIYHKPLAKFSVNVIRVLMVITYPVVMFAALITKVFKNKEGQQSTSREEISALTSMGLTEGIITEREQKMIHNILRLKEIEVEEVMTPRSVTAIANEEMSCEDFLREQAFFPFSRILLSSENEDKITGYVLRRSVLTYIAEDKENIPLKEMKHDIVFAPNTTPLFRVWEHLLNTKEQICLVVNEHGDMVGLVTMEDIIETIVGLEIMDETDSVPDMQQYARDMLEKRKNRQK